MRLLAIMVSLVLPVSTALGQNYQVDWHVVSSGGGSSRSVNYSVDGTAGQPAVGTSSSANFEVQSGFWVWALGAGCDYAAGDINGNGQSNGIDVVYGVAYFKGIGATPIDSCDCRPGVPEFPLYAAGDVNGNCAFNGIDITYFVTYLKGLQQALLYCPGCPPRDDIQSPTVISRRGAVK
jgi:hypothetical protein